VTFPTLCVRRFLKCQVVRFFADKALLKRR
jgi:hypothetical protein